MGMHGCSSNNYCQTLNEGLPAEKFNNRINRYGKSPLSINNTYQTNYSTFGLAAKVLGRPLNYNGTDIVPDASNGNLTRNKVNAICIPGRNTADETTKIVNNKRLNKTMM